MERALLLISFMTLIFLGVVYNAEASDCLAEIQPGVVKVVYSGTSLSLVSDYHRVVVNGKEISKHTKMIKAEESAINSVLFCVPQPDDTIPTIAELSWSKPTHRENGELLGDSLAGYKVYVECVGHSEVVNIQDPDVTTQAFNNLPPGLCMFSITSIDSSGLEGAKSSSVSKDMSTGVVIH